MKKLHLDKWFVLLIILVSACQSNTGTESTADESTESTLAALEATDTTAAAVHLAEYLTSNEVSILNQLKETFDQSIRQGFGQRPLSYVYEQHAIHLRIDALNKELGQQFFSNNRAFSLEEHDALAQQLSLLSDKCGYKFSDDKIINYYCL